MRTLVLCLGLLTLAGCRGDGFRSDVPVAMLEQVRGPVENGRQTVWARVQVTNRSHSDFAADCFAMWAETDRGHLTAGWAPDPSNGIYRRQLSGILRPGAADEGWVWFSIPPSSRIVRIGAR